MKKVLLIAWVGLLLMGTAILPAGAEVYIVCYRRVFIGVDRWGNRLNCLRCDRPIMADGINRNENTLCGGQGKVFNDRMDAWGWIRANCDCP